IAFAAGTIALLISGKSYGGVYRNISSHFRIVINLIQMKQIILFSIISLSFVFCSSVSDKTSEQHAYRKQKND
ncbi:MAG TPA: hypothetical protein VFF29_06545, partial [Bacteroidota bacterium]|nr:hypothetical protein [Bacteroidota bacterium]